MRTIAKYGFVAIIFLLIAGCSQEEEKTIPEIVSITPPDGAVNVAKTTSVKVEFSEAMDMESCESRFALHMGEVTTMPMMMEGMSGHFDWNDGQTMMTFDPDSMLMDSTMYSICLQEGMKSHNHGEGMMMSGMMGHGSHVEDGIISKFITEKE